MPNLLLNPVITSGVRRYYNESRHIVHNRHFAGELISIENVNQIKDQTNLVALDSISTHCINQIEPS